MAQGRYTYSLDVENARALKKLAQFTKATEKATQRVKKDLKEQLQGNIKLKSSLDSLTKRYEKGQRAAIKSSKAGVIDPAVIASQRNLKTRIAETTKAIEKGTRAAKGYRSELGRLKNVPPPPGPQAPRRGFGGNTGRRARLGSAMGGGPAGAVGGLVAKGGGKVLLAVALAAAAKAMIAYGNQAAIAAAKQQKFQMALVGVLGDDTKAGLLTIRKSVDDFNLPIQAATENFTRLAASTRSAGVSSKDTETVFRGMIAANKALGGSNEQLNGILLATQQVFSKGKVTAEELRGQIGERLPGAVSLFATSMGITTAELDKRLEEGTVSVADFVTFCNQLLEQFGEDAKKISEEPSEAGARLQTALNDLQLNVGKLLMPIGAAFQDTFGEIIKIVTRATKAVRFFMAIGLDNELNQAIVERQRLLALKATMDAQGVDFVATTGTGFQGLLNEVTGMPSVISREDLDKQIADANSNAAKLQKDFNLSLGQGLAGMDKGGLVTSADLMANRQGKGKGPGAAANAAANAARALARVQRDEVQKVAELEQKLIRETFGQRLDLTQQQFAGETAAQIGILNTYIRQNHAIDDRATKFLAAVKKAQDELDIAETRLAASAGGTDAIKAQGAVDIARARLRGAETQRDTFAQAEPSLRGASVLSARFASIQPFVEAKKSAEQEAQALKTRNRLIMEGVSGPALEGALRKIELEQALLENIKGVNEQRNISASMATEQINQLTQANVNAKLAIDALTQSQLNQNGALADYVLQVQEFVGDIQGRIVDISQSIENSIADAITGIVSGTKSATEAFRDFFKSIGQAFLQMAAQMIAKLIIIKLLKTSLNMFGLGGFDVSSTPLGAGGGQLGGIGTFGPDFGIPKYANGGIVTAPTTALIGEGGMNEAIVPLPNGRSIPVDMGKGAAGNVQTNITVNVDQGGNTDSQVSGDNANKLGHAIDSAIKRVIMDERRVGGLLYNGGR